MKISNVTNYSVKDLSNTELLELHHRIHKSYVSSKKKMNPMSISILSKKHGVVVSEMVIRKMNHNSPLGNMNINECVNHVLWME